MADIEEIVDPELMDRFNRLFSHVEPFVRHPRATTRGPIQSSSSGAAAGGTGVASFICLAALTTLSTPAAKPSSKTTPFAPGRGGRTLSMIHPSPAPTSIAATNSDPSRNP